MGKGSVEVGTSGWVYSSWRGDFYPAGLAQSAWLSHYAESFSTVEVNSTFYRLARASATERWAASVGPDFRFVVKGSRYLTHIKRLVDVATGLERFFDPLRPLGDKLAAVLWQLPPNMKIDVPRLDAFLASVPSSVVHAVEFRHPSWLTAEVTALMSSHGAMTVNVSGPQFPARTDVTAGRPYVRFHGLRPGYEYDYSAADLAPWAAHLRQYDDGFAFFNNDVGGHAVRNAARVPDAARRADATGPATGGADAVTPGPVRTSWSRAWPAGRVPSSSEVVLVVGRDLLDRRGRRRVVVGLRRRHPGADADDAGGGDGRRSEVSGSHGILLVRDRGRHRQVAQNLDPSPAASR